MPININIGGNVETLIVNGGPLQKVLANGVEVWSAAPPAPTYPPYLTFSSPAAFALEQVLYEIAWDGTLEYSTDKSTWTTWDGATINSAAESGTHYLYLRGTGNTVITGGADKYWVLIGSNITCDGDVRVLLDYANPQSATAGAYCFQELFVEATNLIKAPDILLDAVPNGGCAEMFSGCTALVNAPRIAATSCGTTSFSNMFVNCTSLVSIPKLNILEFKAAACLSMFGGCSLIKLSETQTGEYQTPYRLPAEGTGTVVGTSLTNMFFNTGGTFIGTPTINTTYYTSNAVIG